MEILEEYLKNIQTMTSLMGELGNKNNLRRYNRLAARNRIIAPVINDSIPEYKNEFWGFCVQMIVLFAYGRPITSLK